VGNSRRNTTMVGGKAQSHWFFYGNNPVSLRLQKLPFHIETEIWALWILSENWDGRKAGHVRAPYTIWHTSDGTPIKKIWETLRGLGLKEATELVLHPQLDTLADSWETVRSILEATKPDEITSGRLATRITSESGDDVMMKKLVSWADSHPGKILHGELDCRRRNIGTIADANTLFCD
jgi:hypothetical protein